MDPSLQSYQYAPLNDERQIRVLVLHPGSSDDEIGCHLVHASVDTAQYVALSYVWGDATRRRKVVCDDAFLEITQNLLTALRYLRHQDQDQVVWADAICINQQNQQERGQQVQLMDQIYSSARQTVVWLGEETAEVRDAFRLIERINSHYPESIFTGMANMAFQEHSANLLRVTQGFNAEKINASYDWRPIRELFCRPWFQRKWVCSSIVVHSDQSGHPRGRSLKKYHLAMRTV
jgi:hypothetical protein